MMTVTLLPATNAGGQAGSTAADNVNRASTLAGRKKRPVPRAIPCDCPDDLTSDGSRCGWLSTYCRPGGRKPICEGQSSFKAQ